MIPLSPLFFLDEEKILPPDGCSSSSHNFLSPSSHLFVFLLFPFSFENSPATWRDGFKINVPGPDSWCYTCCHPRHLMSWFQFIKITWDAGCPMHTPLHSSLWLLWQSTPKWMASNTEMYCLTILVPEYPKWRSWRVWLLLRALRENLVHVSLPASAALRAVSGALWFVEICLSFHMTFFLCVNLSHFFFLRTRLILHERLTLHWYGLYLSLTNYICNDPISQ